MKIRSVYIYGHKRLGDVTIDFRETNGVAEGLWLVGGCGAGKTFVTECIASAWGSGALNRSLPYEVQDCRVRVDFDVKGSVAVCQADNGRFSGSPMLRIDSGSRSGLVLHYGMDRVNGFKGSSGVRSVQAIIQDLANGGITDSVILIDDFDLGLDSGDQKLFWSYLWRNYNSGGNQLIVTGKRGLGLVREIVLPVRENPIDLALMALNEKVAKN